MDLLVKPLNVKYIKDEKKYTNLDSWVIISIGNEKKETEVCQGSDKFHTWNNQLKFEIQKEDIEKNETWMIAEVYIKDLSGNSSIVAKGKCPINQFRNIPSANVTAALFNGENKQIAGIQMEITVPRLSRKIARPINSIIVKPRAIKFEIDQRINKSGQYYLRLALDKHCYQTNFAINNSKTITWSDIITFITTEKDIIFVRCYEHTERGEIVIGECIIDLNKFIQERPEFEISNTCSVFKDSRKVGEINFDIEFSDLVFKNLVRTYDPIKIKKGEMLHKKLKYLNQDPEIKTLRIFSEDPETIVIKTPKIKIEPDSQEEIKIKILPPKRDKGIRIDIVKEDTETVEESLYFKIILDS